MLQIEAPLGEVFWDDSKEEFILPKKATLQLEHSLISLSKWESKWVKPFLGFKHTKEEIDDYVRCMTVTPNPPNEAFKFLTEEHYEEINRYIEAPMSATTITRIREESKKKIVTSELIYYWMIALNIPFECQKWHLNRLLKLIQVCEVKSGPQKKMSKQETAKYYSKLNAARRKKYNTKG